MNTVLGFNVIEHLIQNSVLTKDHTVLENIFPSLDSLKIESVFDVIKYRNGEFYASVYNWTKTLLPKNSITHMKCKVNDNCSEMKPTLRTLVWVKI